MKITKVFRKSLAFTLALCMIPSGIPVSANEIEDADIIPSLAETAGEKKVIEPVYQYDFEDGTDISEALKDNAGIIEDSGNTGRGKVLNLNGGYMELPQDLFSKLGTEGFTISMWVNADANNNDYSKIFDASNAQLGESSAGATGWYGDPDFALAAGGGSYDLSLYVGDAKTNAAYQSQLKYDKSLTRGQWQHMAVSVSPEDYQVYFDGKKVEYNSVANKKPITETLDALFTDDYLATLKYAALGKSYYSENPNFKGLLDDVKFYSLALSEGQAKELYSTGEVEDIQEPGTPGEPEAPGELVVKEPVWNFDFEDGTAGDGNLEGGASIESDSTRNGKVLNLNGGYMGLPEDLFSKLGTEGFTISMWVNADSSTGDYTKIFDASNAPLGETSDGGNGWCCPDFALAAGGGNYDLSLYVGDAKTTAAYQSQLKYDKSLARGKWQHMSVSVSPEDYQVYFDGKKVGYNSVANKKPITETLAALFTDDYLATLKYASFGKSYYSSDANFKGMLDDVKFYDIALNEEQAEGLYTKGYVEIPPESETPEEPEPEIPEPVYKFDFEDGTAGAGKLQGEASIKNDGGKGGKVLSLNGNGHMELPEELFGKLGTNGFTISMWVKADANNNNYSKVFDASNAPLGESNAGVTGWWGDPDFALAAGGGDYDLALYVGDAGKAADYKSKLKYNKHLARGQWQHMAVSISPEEYQVYFDGKKVGYNSVDANSIEDTLAALFANNYLATLKYAALGKSYYTSDSNFAGRMDDINFYNEALSEKQVKKLYEGYGEISNEPDPVAMTVDMSKTTGDVKHGATGFLYGIGEDNVPDVNLMTAIKPYMCEQKPADGLQHPNGDILIMADTFIEAGGDSIQIACPDIYAEWPYEFQGFDEYMEKLEVIVKQVKKAGLSSKAVYVLYNEPEGNWFQPPDPDNPGQTKWGLDIDKFNKYWKVAYDTVKAIDPEARTAGPNLCLYNDSHLKNFIKFCAENDCIPDQLTWHVLTDANYSTFPADVANVRKHEKQYWIDAGLTKEPKEIVINEYAEFTQLGVPGQLVRWIGLFEDEKATACLAYWHLSNNLCDLAASNNEPNGAWWLFKWYAEMSGETLKVETEGAAHTQFYGLASLDKNKKSSMVLLGGVDGTVPVTLKNIDKNIFGNKVKVKVESTSWTGINGAAEAPVFVKEEVYPVNSDGTVEVQMDGMVAASAYRLTVTQADDSEEGITSSGAWRKTYEGEDAVLAGGAYKAGKSSIYACSGTGQAQGLNSAGASATFKVDVPQDGWYRFDMVYGAATGNNVKNTDRNDPKNALQTLSVDGEKQADMYLENTLDFYMSGQHTEYIELTAGEHSLKVEATDSEGKASIDCMYLTYVGDDSALYQEQNVKTYEAELSDYNVLGNQTKTNVHTDNSIAGYSAAGYATGLNVSVRDGGGIRFTTFANENGMYNIKVKYSSEEAAVVNYYINNTNLTLNRLADSKKVEATNGKWEEAVTTLFLKKGINIIDLDASSAVLAVDTLTVEWADNNDATTVIEAEDCETTGQVEVKENSNASGGKYVEGILADKDAKNSLTVNYDAPVEGTYEFAVYQSNEELFGAHDYNAQMIDRFITISVNEGEPQNVYFRNTYSADSFRSQVITLYLKRGANTIKIYNSDYRVHKKGVNGVDVCTNYTPNLDKFEITRSSLSEGNKTDIICPTGEIIIDGKKWNSFLEKITFELMFDRKQEVTISGKDNESGLDKIYYYQSPEELTLKQVENIKSGEWTEISNGSSFYIEQDKKVVIYAKITDKAGNITYLSSDGVVVVKPEEDSKVNISDKEGSGIVQTATVKDEGLPTTKIENLDKETATGLLSEEDVKKVEDGENALIYLDIKDADKEENLNKDDREIIEKEAKAQGANIGILLDISLCKKIGNGKAETIEDTKGVKIKVAVVIPESLILKDNTKKRDYYVIRMHNKIAEVIPAYLEGGMLKFTTDKFSIYTIAYKDTKKSTDQISQYIPSINNGGATATPVPGTPTATPVPEKPSATPAPEKPTVTPVPEKPANTPVPGTPDGTPVPGTPSATPVPGTSSVPSTPSFKPSTDISKAKKEKNALALNKGIKVNQTGSKITVEWGKVTGADGYDVYVQYCGLKFNKKADYSVKGNTVKKLTIKKINNKKIDLKKNYKVYVNAYKLADGRKITAGRSITAHIAGSNSKKYTNVKEVKVKKNSYSLKAGKTAKIEASIVLYSPDKKKFSGKHVKEFRYASSNNKVAVVSSKGKIKAVKKGNCTIYVYAANGYTQKIKVKVK